MFFFYDIFMVFISPAIFKTSVMLTVATAGAPKESIDEFGKCQRTSGEAMPMLMLLPRLAPYDPPLTGLSPPPPLAPPAAVLEDWPAVGSLAWRLSGDTGDFAMIGLGDIVLPGELLVAGWGSRWGNG